MWPKVPVDIGRSAHFDVLMPLAGGRQGRHQVTRSGVRSQDDIRSKRPCERFPSRVVAFGYHGDERFGSFATRPPDRLEGALTARPEAKHDRSRRESLKQKPRCRSGRRDHRMPRARDQDAQERCKERVRLDDEGNWKVFLLYHARLPTIGYRGRARESEARSVQCGVGHALSRARARGRCGSHSASAARRR